MGDIGKKEKKKNIILKFNCLKNLGFQKLLNSCI